MPQNNELRLFISSTFRDMQEEREHLVKKVFPEIRALCRRRGIQFTDVDLRWGLTDEQAALGTVIRTCLEEVDKCRPFFIGMIGSRYGWVPELHDIMMDPDLLAKYPFVEDVALEGASVTEMEFIHGVFDASEVEGGYSFFYRRDGDLEDADDPERLGELIERVRSTGRPFREFTDVEELGRVVRDDLLTIIEELWPEGAPSELDLERRAHAAYAASRTRAYIPNPHYLKTFTTWLAEGTTPLVVTGQSGLGKSSLVAYLTDYYHGKNESDFVIAHYVGASQSSGTALSIIRHIIEAIRLRFDIDEEMPTKPEELQKSFPNWLFRCEHLARQNGIGVLIVIDALNQLDETGRRIGWLPETIPSGVKLIVSTTPGDAGERLSEREWSDLRVEPLEDERVRQSIVVRYLGEFRKGVNPDQLHRLVTDEKSRSPLYLRVVAEELRLHGQHETLDEVIDRCCSAGDTLDLFDLVLERMEWDYDETDVRDLLSLIACSRSGLDEEDLLELVGVSRLDLSRLLFAFDYHLLQRSGLLNFFHDYLLRAVEKRYLSTPEKRSGMYRRLATWFEAAPVNLHTSRQLLHALEKLGDRAGLDRVLTSMERFTELWNADPNEVIHYWSERDPPEIVSAYTSGLLAWEEGDHEETVQAEVLRAVADLFWRLSAWEESERLTQRVLEIVVRLGDQFTELRGRVHLANLARVLGRPEESLSMLKEIEPLARDLGDTRLLCRIIFFQGRVHMIRGHSDSAIPLFREQERIARETGDRLNVGKALCNLGYAYEERGDYEQASACFREHEQIARELGDPHEISMALANRADEYVRSGEMEEALACYREHERIVRSLNDRNWRAIGLISRGEIHAKMGDFADAMTCYQEARQLLREINDRGLLANLAGSLGRLHGERGETDKALALFEEQREYAEEQNNGWMLGIALGEIGTVHADHGNHAEALKNLFRALELHREISYLEATATWLQQISDCFLAIHETTDSMPLFLADYVPTASEKDWQRATLASARAHAEECVEISRKLSKAKATFSGQVALARVAAAEGSTEKAERVLILLLEDVVDDDHRAELHYRLWKLDPDGTDHASEALALYESLFERTPAHLYRQRADELREEMEGLTDRNAPTTGEINDVEE